MYTPPKTWVRGALVGLALAAVVGTWIGVSRSGAGAAGVPVDPGAPTPSSTTTAKALPDGPLIDEDRVRTLARQEAEAALARSRPAKKVPSADETDEPSTDVATPTVTTTPVPRSAPVRAPTTSAGALPSGQQIPY